VSPTQVRQQRGFTMIEVMVTVLLLSIGLLGMLGMQTRASAAEFESYQRGQAIALARDMQARLLSARGIVPGYLNPAISSADGSVWVGNGSGAATYVDANGNCPQPIAGDLASFAAAQACAWGRDLQGAAMTDSAGPVGAMVGARGCLIRVEPPQQNALADLYVVIVWQGIEQRNDPAADSPAGRCASDVDFGPGQRRGISMRVLVPDLRKAA
jgi:type IV pilus assembly protein PilV